VDWDEARVDAAVFPRREPTIAVKNPARTPPDFGAIHEQLRGSKYVTLQLLGGRADWGCSSPENGFIHGKRLLNRSSA